MVTTYGDMVPLFVTVQFFLLRLKEQSQQNRHRLFGYLFLRMQCIRGVSKRLLFGWLSNTCRRYACKTPHRARLRRQQPGSISPHAAAAHAVGWVGLPNETTFSFIFLLYFVIKISNLQTDFKFMFLIILWTKLDHIYYINFKN